MIFTTFLTHGESRAGRVLNFTPSANTFVDGVDRVMGWEFRTSSQPVTATKLECFDAGQNGLAVAHTVAIYKKSTQQLIVSAIVPAGNVAPLEGFFRVVPITPLLLDPNTDYVVAATWPGNADAQVWEGGQLGIDMLGLTTDPLVATGVAQAPYLAFTAALAYPTQTIPGDSRAFWVGPNVTVTGSPTFLADSQNQFSHAQGLSGWHHGYRDLSLDGGGIYTTAKFIPLSLYPSIFTALKIR